MNEDLTQKLQNILSTLDKDKLKKSKMEVENFLSTPEGKKLISNLKNEDKEKILQKFMNIDTGKIKNKLNSDKMSGLSRMTADDILKKLR